MAWEIKTSNMHDELMMNSSSYTNEREKTMNLCHSLTPMEWVQE